MERPDFDALRAERNEKMEAVIAEWRAEGFAMSPCSLRDKSACYCACGQGGPCEHDWSGKPFESDYGWSATCSRCGASAISHSLRTAE